MVLFNAYLISLNYAGLYIIFYSMNNFHFEEVESIINIKIFLFEKNIFTLKD